MQKSINSFFSCGDSLAYLAYIPGVSRIICMTSCLVSFCPKICSVVNLPLVIKYLLLNRSSKWSNYGETPD